MKYKCYKCHFAMAVWCYIPGDFTGIEEERYECDNCISRGCSCNWDEENNQEFQDNQGRRYPCCEYDYEPNGFENDNYDDWEVSDEYIKWGEDE